MHRRLGKCGPDWKDSHRALNGGSVSGTVRDVWVEDHGMHNDEGTNLR